MASITKDPLPGTPVHRVSRKELSYLLCSIHGLGHTYHITPIINIIIGGLLPGRCGHSNVPFLTELVVMVASLQTTCPSVVRLLL